MMQHSNRTGFNPQRVPEDGALASAITGELEHIRMQHNLSCIIVIDGDGKLIAQVGDHPKGDEFALYSPMVMETTRTMARCGGFGEPVCNGVILNSGRILITHQEVVNGRVIYLSLLCRKKVPEGLLALLQHITAMVAENELP
ncbi:hypothetical protein Ga0123462_0951 [Mariprofundus ferrinatatus]|uniref:Roadblock/LAMTOR2 domain-containing protein n=1 Tax=Mariprofundus ferrinatatus TaxID=1921087 RepID=A0A2K8L3B2_9PROT|nr:hypothetical protein [Mariprofundus ferrinatatus]ATX81820.1 hypothetical protein Ga0123462_0951 [Mariprofundus ferrinatatus]